MKAMLLMLAGLIIGTAALLQAEPSNRPGEKPRESAASPNSGNADMQKFAMLTGCWVRTQGNDWLEETWSAPSGDCMVGMFRWMKAGKVWMTEAMSIHLEDGRPVFSIRHFDRKMHAWEEKDAPLSFPLKSISEMEVVFEDPDREYPQRFTFSRPDSKRFIIRFEGTKNGKKTGSQFDFVAADHGNTPDADEQPD